MPTIPLANLSLLEIVRHFREEVDDLRGSVDDPDEWEQDDKGLLWSNLEAARFANEAQREFCRRRAIIDSVTPEVVEIPLVANTDTYVFDNRIIFIKRAILDHGDLINNGGFADATIWTLGTDWSIANGVASKAAGAVISDVEQTIPVDNAKDYTVKFTVSAYVAGTATPFIGTVLGTGRTANGTFTETITAVASADVLAGIRGDAAGDFSVDVISIIQVGTLNRPPLTKKRLDQLDTEEPGWHARVGVTLPDKYIEDLDEYQIRIVAPPSVNRKLRLTVGRLPLIDMEWACRTEHSLEIPPRAQLDLIDWMAHKAYLKRDSQTFDEERSQGYAERFALKVGFRPTARVEQERREERNHRRHVRAYYF